MKQLPNGWKSFLWSEEVKERDDYTCQFCGCHENKMYAQHIVPTSISKALWYEVANGLTLCPTCHAELHTIDFDYAIIKKIVAKLQIDVNYGQDKQDK